MSSGLYGHELMEHYKNSFFRGKIENPDIFSDEFNPSCGDRISISAKVDLGRICEIKFYGSGCVLSQAAASLLLEYVIDKTLDEVLSISKDDILKMVGIDLGPNRLKCALLSLEALKNAVSKFDSNKN